MSGTDFDLAAYEADLAEFERRERNDSQGVFGVIANHVEHSDHGAGAAAMVDSIEPMPEQAIPEAARAVLSAMIDATRLHPQGGAVLAARISNPTLRTMRELGAVCNLGKSVTGEAVTKLRSDPRFAGLFPTTAKVCGQQKRRQREARQVEASTKQCLGCGALFRAVKNQRYCKDCRPSEPAPARQRGAFYPGEVDV